MRPLNPGEARDDLEERAAALALLPARNETGEEVGGHGESERGECPREDVQMESEWSPQARL